VGGGAGVGVGVGTSYAKNDIGNGDNSGVFANVTNATLAATSNITISADMTSEIKSFVGSFAVALAGGYVGVAGAGAGAFAVNTIDYAVITRVNDSDLTAGGTVSVLATDNAIIDATVASASVSAAFGVIAFAGAVAVSTADNDVDNTIEASVNRSSVEAANLTIDAKDNTKVDVESRAAAVAVSGGIGAALSGGGALADIDATSTVRADLTGAGAADQHPPRRQQQERAGQCWRRRSRRRYIAH
jgi:hypothetical protein